MRFLLQPVDERACLLQCRVEIVDPEEQEEPVAWRRAVGTCKRRMIVFTPLVEAEEDGAI